MLMVTLEVISKVVLGVKVDQVISKVVILALIKCLVRSLEAQVKDLLVINKGILIVEHSKKVVTNHHLKR